MDVRAISLIVLLIVAGCLGASPTEESDHVTGAESPTLTGTIREPSFSTSPPASTGSTCAGSCWIVQSITFAFNFSEDYNGSGLERALAGLNATVQSRAPDGIAAVLPGCAPSNCTSIQAAPNHAGWTLSIIVSDRNQTFPSMEAATDFGLSALCPAHEAAAIAWESKLESALRANATARAPCVATPAPIPP